jgi:hypothetical protein
MDMLLTFMVPAVLFLALEFLWCRPARLNRPSDARGDHEPRPGSPLLVPDGDPFALSFVQQRLDALAAELVRLENDPAAFARAFHTHVAKSAYKALLADAVRLGNASRLSAVSPLPGTTIVEIEASTSRAPLREELSV